MIDVSKTFVDESCKHYGLGSSLEREVQFHLFEACIQGDKLQGKSTIQTWCLSI
jgi:hypothetical protein